MVINADLLEVHSPRLFEDNMEYTGREYSFYIPEDVLNFIKINTHFKALKESWLRETAYLSDPNIRFNNMYYNQIVALGEGVAPMLFDELLSYQIDWFDALAKIYGINPVRPESRGNYEEMVSDWKYWRLMKILAA
jgi:hypothetical protein